MLWIFIFAVLSVLAVVGWRVAKRVQKGIDAHPQDYEIKHAYPRLWAGVAVVFGVLTAFVVVVNSIVSVPTKDVGVETAYGKTTGFLTNGLHLKAPWVNVTTMDAAIQTDVFQANDALQVRVANQQIAYVPITIRWRINPRDVDSLFQNYRTFDHVRASLVTPELHQAVNAQFAAYNPLDSIINNNGQVLNTKQQNDYAVGVTNQMRSEIGQAGIEVQNVIIPLITFDQPTQDRLNGLQQQIALTRIAQQQQQTNAATAAANAALAASVNTSPNVLVSRCLDDLDTMVKTHQVVPIGFSCWPGGGTQAVIGQGGR